MVDRGFQNRREELMETLDTQWGRYLPTINALPEDDQQQYAQQQGFNSVRDLLAHITAWWRTAVEVVAAVQSGQTFSRDWEDDEAFDARVIAGAASRTRAVVEEDFEIMRESLGGLIAELPEESLDHPEVVEWLYKTIIDHYRIHQPPGDPRIPAQQHT